MRVGSAHANDEARHVPSNASISSPPAAPAATVGDIDQFLQQLSAGLEPDPRRCDPAGRASCPPWLCGADSWSACCAASAIRRRCGGCSASQILQALQLEVAGRAGVDSFEVSLALLVAEAPRYAEAGGDPAAALSPRARQRATSALPPDPDHGVICPARAARAAAGRPQPEPARPLRRT